MDPYIGVVYKYLVIRLAYAAINELTAPQETYLLTPQIYTPDWSAHLTINT